jgi:pimeloyl-ACP methyl ester carboxylesterase
MTTVFLHPIGLDARSWQFLSSASTHGAVLYDLLWHGGRAKPTAPLSLHAFAEDVVKNVDGDLDIIGISMGGAIAQEIAIRWPNRVRSLLLACTTAGGDGGGALYAHADAVESSGMAGIVDSTLRRWFSPGALHIASDPAVDYARERLLTDSAESFGESWRALAENNAIVELDSILAPTTVLHAIGDASGPAESRRVIADGIRVSRFVEAPGPHMIQLERPTVFDTVLADHRSWSDSVLGEAPQRAGTK